jgi:predicted nucleotidyltransferase
VKEIMAEMKVQYDEKELERLCHKYHVRRLDLFGSRAKGTAAAESDVDLLVEYEPGHVPGLLGFLRLEEELKALFGGHSVDLISKSGLSPYLRDETLRTRSPLYEQCSRVLNAHSGFPV